MIGGTTEVEDGYAANCLYNHPNFPDGFLRTSVHQLARYQMAYLAGGNLDGKEILSAQSTQRMLTKGGATEPEESEHMGLVWFAVGRPGREDEWEHTGGDPGINTLCRFQPSSQCGVIVFANTWGASLNEVGKRLLDQLRSV